MEKPGLLDWALTPLTWLERSSGWRRKGLFFFYLFTALVLGLIGWLSLSLWRLPDIGEPFDLARFGTVEVPDAANAMVLYRKAETTLLSHSEANYKILAPKAWNVLDWATAEPEVRRWVVDNRPGFATWLEGTERPDSLLFQPKDLTTYSDRKSAYSLRSFAWMAALEASRIAAEGDVEGAWRLYRAALRTSRHAGMHGPMMQRHVGQIILTMVRPEILRWIVDPRVTTEMFRRAITDVEACKAMTSPNSEMVRADYFANRSLVDLYGESPRNFFDGSEVGEWYNHVSIVPKARLFFKREPERTRRVHNLITAGILAQCDRPRALRPKLASSKYMIYDLDSRTPANVAAIVPEDLTSWADRSGYAAIASDMGFLFTQIDGETSTFDSFLLQMAERAYEIEHGRSARTYGDLIGPYLKALPNGIEPSDATGAPQASN